MSLFLSEQSLAGAVPSLAGMCAAIGLPRSSYYRLRHLSEPLCGDVLLRDQIQRIALEWPGYGYRRIAKQLERQGTLANHKSVLRLMREDNLLCLRKKRFFLTTDSAHGLPVYPNLVPTLCVQDLDRLWVADITYIRLRQEFIYLAVVLDAFSRRVIGWEISPRIDTPLTLGALERALSARSPQPGLVHHSDRGVQYASTDYIARLLLKGIRPSMSRRGNPYDNAQAESFIKTLKYEQVYLSEYENIKEARARIGHFLEEVYNAKRLHSALGYTPPIEYEQTFRQASDA
jgi:transposase InsO family protein